MAFERRLLPRGGGRLALVAAIALGTAAGGLVVVQASLLSSLIAAMGQGHRLALHLPTPVHAPALHPSAVPALVALSGIALLRALASWASEVAAARAAADVRLSLRDALTTRLLGLGPRFLAGERTGELVNTLGAGVESTEAYVARYLPQLALSMTVPLVVGTAVFRADSLSGFVLAATWPLIPLFMYLIGASARERSRAQWVTLSRLSARLLDAIQGVRTLALLGRAGEETDRIAESSERFRAVTLKVLKIAFLSALTLELLATLGTAVVAVELGLRLLYARIAFEAALFVLVVTPEFYRPLRALGAAFHAAMSGREAAARAGEILDASPAIGPRGALRHAQGALSPSKRERALPQIAFDRVSFRYLPGRSLALDDVSFTAAAGSITALVGPSGSGKSTIAHLVLRFLEPDAGRLLVGGMPLDMLHPDEWRQRLAWLPQRPHLFHASVLDNLCLGRPGAQASDIERALCLAHADDVVRKLPRGLGTVLGENAAQLSGGEAQRLALARAFLKDAPLIVLDEPTSHLDAENDALVSDAVRALSEGRTVLLIAHRLTAIGNAARIVVLSHGRVVEQGTASELLAGDGVYSRMVSASQEPA